MARKRSVIRSATLLKMEQIVRLQVMGRSADDIAALLGCTAGDVSDLIRHRDYKRLRDTYVTKVYEGLDRVIEQRTAGQLLVEAAPDAAEALISLLYSEDPLVKDRAARSVLDRSGFGPIQRRAVRARVALDPVTARIMGEAMRESRLDAGEEPALLVEHGT